MKIIEILYYKQENCSTVKQYTFWNRIYRWYYWSIFNKGGRK
jgi:hypothetical protein